MSDVNQKPSGEPGQGASPRASIRGMGWEILRGESPPEHYVAGLPEEDAQTEAPLLAETVGDPRAATGQLAGARQSDSAAVLDRLAAPEYSKLHGQTTPTPMPRTERQASLTEPAAPPAAALEYEATPRIESALRGVLPARPTYEPRPAVAQITPDQPEDVTTTSAAEGARLALSREDLAEAALLGLEPIPTGPTPTAPRPGSGDLFGDAQDIPPADDLLDRFVTDERLDELWGEVEALQAALAEATPGNRARYDTYQKEVLQAYTLLLQNRANYDDVRAIVYRIRGELRQDARSAEAIQQYRPRLLIFFVISLLIWAGLMLLEPAFGRFVTDALDVRLLALLYHPTLFGMLGAILNGYFTLNRHMIHERDFDPVHVSWYVMNPLVGAIMGLLMALLFGTGIVSTVGISALAQEPAGQYPFLLWVLCFLAGYNQNVVMRLLSWTFDQLRGADDNTPTSGEASSPLS